MSYSSLLAAAIVGIATLLGTTLGAIIAYLGQRSQLLKQHSARWDTTKKDLYVKFITHCNEDFFYLRDIYRDALENSKFSIASEIRPMRHELFLNIISEISLLGTDDVVDSSIAVMNYFESLEELLRTDRPLREIEQQLDRYGNAMSNFRHCAMLDLGVTTPP